MINLSENNNFEFLSNAQINQYNNNGYVVVKSVLSKNMLEKAKKYYSIMRQKCENGKYNHLRRYNNLSSWDIYAIEDIFHPDIFEKEIFKAIMDSKALEMSQQILNSPVFLSLSRLHCTKYFSHSGCWHRDVGLPSKGLEYIDTLIEQKLFNHVQITLPFFDEEGFFIVKDSHLKNDKYIKTSYVIRPPNKRIYDDEINIPLKAGDIILFNPLLIHRGSCKGRIKNQRAHIHMRFSKRSAASNSERSKNDFKYYNGKDVFDCANENWKISFKDDLPESNSWRNEIINLEENNLSFRGHIDKLKNRIKYNISKFIPLPNRKVENIKYFIFPYLK